MGCGAGNMAARVAGECCHYLSVVVNYRLAGAAEGVAKVCWSSPAVCHATAHGLLGMGLALAPVFWGRRSSAGTA